MLTIIWRFAEPALAIFGALVLAACAILSLLLFIVAINDNEPSH